MHDLNTINRLNAQAHEKAITDWRNDGKFAVTVYEGLHLVAAEPHDTPAGAAEAAAKLGAKLGVTANILPPFPPEQRVGKARDQSEDRGVSFESAAEYLAATGQCEA